MMFTKQIVLRRGIAGHWKITLRVRHLSNMPLLLSPIPASLEANAETITLRVIAHVGTTASSATMVTLPLAEVVAVNPGDVRNVHVVTRRAVIARTGLLVTDAARVKANAKAEPAAPPSATFLEDRPMASKSMPAYANFTYRTAAVKAAVVHGTTRKYARHGVPANVKETLILASICTSTPPSGRNGGPLLARLALHITSHRAADRTAPAAGLRGGHENEGARSPPAEPLVEVASRRRVQRVLKAEIKAGRALAPQSVRGDKLNRMQTKPNDAPEIALNRLIHASESLR